jgi:antitoxin component YwqK of YwqJK toxin-antitoxin module
VINYLDKVVYASVMTNSKKVSVKNDRFYYWYKANDIKTSQGGFEGKLLDGSYTEFYPDKNLKEQGFFKTGLKNGVWKTWHHNGKLASISKWKKGKLNGVFKIFSVDGEILSEGKYKEDKLNGEIITFLDSGKVIVKNYKKGQQAKASPKKEK